MPTSPIRTTSKSPSSGCASGRELHRRRRARRRSRRSRRASRPRRSPSSSCTVTSVFSHSKKTRVERVEERRLAAERLRHPVRALRDGAAHPDRADVGEPALGVLAAPGAIADAADVDRPRRRRRARRRTASSNFVGIPYVRPKSMPVPSGIVASSDVAPGDPVHDLVQRPVAADRDDERRAARRPPARELDQVARPLREERLARRARAARRGARAPASACPSRRWRTPG